MNMPCRVMLVDDHKIVQCAISHILASAPGIELTAYAESISEALDVVKQQPIDLAMVDISLPDGLGLTLLDKMRRRWPHVRTIVMTMHEEDKYGMRAVMAGASGYLLKCQPESEVLDAVHRVANGGTCFSKRLSSQLLQQASGRGTKSTGSLPALSDRELEILAMLGSGMSSSEIAVQLSRSIKTIDAHREHIKKKLNIANATELIRFAVCWVEGDKMDRYSA